MLAADLRSSSNFLERLGGGNNLPVRTGPLKTTKKLDLEAFVAMVGRVKYNIIMASIRFEWDAKKDQANQRKHGISFFEAQSVFYDDNAKLIHDPEHSEEEDRFILLGISSSSRVLIVCHCYKESDEVIRIISARKATKRESGQYRGGK